MLSPRLRIVVLSILCCGISGRMASAGSVVVNGGFESGSFSGWTLSGNTQFTYVTSTDLTSKGAGSYAPHGGNDYALLGPTGSVGELSQTIATTPGQEYTFSWWLASDGDFANSFSASWGGTTIFNQTDLPTQGYVLYTYTETATTASTTIAFSFRDDPGYLSLDDVSVTALADPNNGPQGGQAGGGGQAVPEPAAILLACIGGLAVAACHRFRRRGD